MSLLISFAYNRILLHSFQEATADDDVEFDDEQAEQEAYESEALQNGAA